MSKVQRIILFLSYFLTPIHMYILYQNLMIKIYLTKFCRKYISRIVGNLEMSVDVSVVGINAVVVPFVKGAFTFDGIKVIVVRRFL